MFNEDEFLTLGLHVVELPPEEVHGILHYQVFLKELPFILGEGKTKLEAYQKLTQQYSEYRQQFLKEQEEEETTKQLDLKELLRYYDGENFDGFETRLNKK